MQMADEVPEGSGADSRQGSVGSGADSRQGSGGFRCRKLMRIRRVPVQMADEVPEGYGADC